MIRDDSTDLKGAAHFERELGSLDEPEGLDVLDGHERYECRQARASRSARRRVSRERRTVMRDAMGWERADSFEEDGEW